MNYLIYRMTVLLTLLALVDIKEIDPLVKVEECLEFGKVVASFVIVTASVINDVLMEIVLVVLTTDCELTDFSLLWRLRKRKWRVYKSLT